MMITIRLFFQIYIREIGQQAILLSIVVVRGRWQLKCRLTKMKLMELVAWDLLWVPDEEHGVV